MWLQSALVDALNAAIGGRVSRKLSRLTRVVRIF